MDLRHLRAFTAVAELRSFSKAARRLHLSQPPLSRHIRQLEDEVGVQLFVRNTSRVELTREGALLLEKARGVLGEVTAFLELAGRTKSGVASTLKVGMARGLCEAVNRIRLRLVDRSPEVLIEGTDMPSFRQYEALRHRAIDLGVLRHVADDPGVECEVLFEERFVAVVSERSPLARCRSLCLKQLADEPLLLHERNWAALAFDKILSLYATAGVTPNVVTLQAEPGDQASMLAVASGGGICLALHSPLSRSYLSVNGVVAVPLDEPDADLQVQVAWRRGEASHSVRQFLESVREVFPRN
jgi:DNA-binding transcriptional LysR family regulator